MKPNEWLRRATLVLAALAAMLAAGCWPFGSSGRPGAVPEEQAAAPAAKLELQRPEVRARPVTVPEAGPRVSPLLADLQGADMLKCWRAEEALREMGPTMAPYVRAMFASPSPQARSAACRLAFRLNDWQAVPGIIALLADESLVVRRTANVYLCGLTGEDFGFRPEATPGDRAAAQARWTNWYAARLAQAPAGGR